MSQGPSLGVDVGGTKTHGVLLSASGQVLADHVRPTEPGPAGVPASVLAVVDDCLRQAGLERAALAGIGVGIPGQVDHVGKVVRTAVNLGIERLELGRLLEAELRVPVGLDNDVKATALGASALLGGDLGDLSYLNFGTGVAAASLVGGALVRGEGNLAGEIGHVPVRPDGDTCMCGQRGCLEVEVGGGRIAARLAHLEPPVLLPGLVAAAASGHRGARGELGRISAGIADALQLVVLAHGSAKVVLGGGVIHATPGLVDEVRRVLGERASASPFLASLDLPGRIVVLPPDQPVAAVGAALVGRAAAALVGAWFTLGPG